MNTTAPAALTPLSSMIARELANAYRSGKAWTPEAFDDSLSVGDAYGVQAAVAKELGWFADGRVPAWKAGGKGQMTAAALPVVLQSGATWQPGATRDILMEAEVAFRLGKTPTSADDVLACIATMCVSIEMVGTRMVGGMTAPGPWKTADQQMHGVLVTGAEIPFAPRDWMEQAYTVAINGTVQSSSKGTHPNGNAPQPFPWLFAHAKVFGRDLKAGDLVTTGAWAVIKVQPGDLIEVSFDGIGKAAVTVAAA